VLIAAESADPAAPGNHSTAGFRFTVISAAALFPELLHAVLRSTAAPQPVYVVDENGKLAGEVFADRVRDPASEHFPLETATAADFAKPIEPIINSDDETTIAARFTSAGRDTLPVIDKETGELIGVDHSPVGREYDVAAQVVSRFAH
jgi:hypothetical protein